MKMLELEVFAILAAYLLAGIPIAGIVLAGRIVPLYRLPTVYVCRVWSRMALILVAVVVVVNAASLLTN
jgi:hypothetical protein